MTSLLTSLLTSEIKEIRNCKKSESAKPKKIRKCKTQKKQKNKKTKNKKPKERFFVFCFLFFYKNDVLTRLIYEYLKRCCM